MQVTKVLLVLGVMLGVVAREAMAQQRVASDATALVEEVRPEEIAAPAWLEPQGVNVIELVGLVPEEHLRGAVLSFNTVNGILQYLEGQRYADRVVMRVKVWPHFEPTYHTFLDCPSLRALSDHWLVAMPAGSVRLFQGEVDITDRIAWFDYFPGGLIQPTRPATGERYPAIRNAPIEFDETGAMKLPANHGCTMRIDGIFDQGDLTAVFTLYTPQMITVKTLGSQTFTFGGYRGPGFSGKVAALQEQLYRFGNRHDKFTIEIPSEADFVLLNYPTSPVSPYIVGDISRNIVTPSSGTYRLASGPGALSTDHQITMGLPLFAQWRDADQADGRFLSLLRPINMVTALEYFVPAGIPYHPCMQFGGCADELLQKIVNATMEMTLYYYRIDAIGNGLLRIPLRQVGRQYSTSADAAARGSASTDYAYMTATAGSAQVEFLSPALKQVVHLPMLGRSAARDGQDSPLETLQDCPCGLFTPDGRMVDVIP